jgi:hypothetical protein
MTFEMKALYSVFEMMNESGTRDILIQLEDSAVKVLSKVLGQCGDACGN